SVSSHEDIQNGRDEKSEPLITSDYCVDELLTLLLVRKRSALALRTGWQIFNEEICRLHFLTPEQIRRAWVIFQSKSYLGWSFTDCTSKVVMDDLGIRTAVALDQHFRQFGLTSVVP